VKKKFEEQVVQEFPYRCPYCGQPVSYDRLDLKIGENEIQCPSCKKKYIKVVLDRSPSPSPSSVKGEGKKGSVKGEERKGSTVKRKIIRKIRRR
jgi:DNA-directed RNA polymerase subunit RPC12/RpoP